MQLRDDGLQRRRTFVADPSGDTVPELELRALEMAAEFFGPGVPLEISVDYSAGRNHKEGQPKYWAAIPVHELVPAEV